MNEPVGPRAVLRSTSMRFGVIVNPSSRDNRRNPGRVRTLAAQLGSRGSVFEASTPEALDDYLRTLHTEGVRYLGICGGDGTQHLTISRALPIWNDDPLPTLVPLRGGTMNTVSSSVGVARRSPEALLDSVLAREAGGALRFAQRATARIGDNVGFLFGVGAVHGFLAEYYRDGDPNAVTAARTLWRAAAGALSDVVARKTSYGGATARVAAPFRGHVGFREGPDWEVRDYLAITGGTIEDMGLGFRPFAAARSRASAFQLLGIHGNAAALAAALPRLWRSRPLSGKVAYDTLTTYACITPEADLPYGYMMDGDLYEHNGPLTIESGPMVEFAY